LNRDICGLFSSIALIIADLFLSATKIAIMQLITSIWLLWLAPEASLNK
jgi:hypothetical protein